MVATMWINHGNDMKPTSQPVYIEGNNTELLQWMAQLTDLDYCEKMK